MVREYQDKAIINWVRAGFTVTPEPHRLVATNEVSRIVSYEMTSPLALKAILQLFESPEFPVCFYLDAHWGAYFPLPDELNVIAHWKGKNKCVIIIHDCQVPGKDFAYDSYNGKPISYETFKDQLAQINPDFKISYNESYEAKEPGHPVGQGILYCTP